MKVAYSSITEFMKLTPDADTVVVSLLGNTDDDIEVLPNGGWKSNLRKKFLVIKPNGPLGSFAGMDDQAAQLADDIYEYIKDAKRVIIVCEYGEIRSPAVAAGIAYSDLGDCGDIYMISEGRWLSAELLGSTTFQSRTIGNLAATFDLLIKEDEAINKSKLN